MMIQSFEPGPGTPFPSASSSPIGTVAATPVLGLGELERLGRVGVRHGVRLGLRRRVRTVRVTTPFFNSCLGKIQMVALIRKLQKNTNLTFILKQ